MDVVSHKDPGINFATMTCACLVQVISKITVIFICDKNRASVITALNDVLNYK